MPAGRPEQDKSFCEFFAGIGLVHEALRQSGWHAVYANDIDAKKRQMYEGNYGPAPHYHEGDVWDAEAVLARIEGRPFLATASFPCTDMSLAGKRRGLAGEQSGALFGFLQAIEQLGDRQPRIVLLENVPGFLTSHGGKDFETAVHALAGLGYWIDSFVMDARWFVPQSRPRLFLIGYDKGLVDLPILRVASQDPRRNEGWLRAAKKLEDFRPSRLLERMESIKPATGWVTIDCEPPKEKKLSVVDFLDAHASHEWWSPAEVQRHKKMMHTRHRQELRRLVKQNGRPFTATAFRRIRSGEQRLELRFDGIAGCLRTPRGGSAKQIVVTDDGATLRMRWMTPREYASLQGAPEFSLPKNLIQGYFGFGDAVCVPVIEWIDEQFLTPVFNLASTVKSNGDKSFIYK